MAGTNTLMDPDDDKAFFRVIDTVNSTLLTPTVVLEDATLAVVIVAGEKLIVLDLVALKVPVEE